MQLNMFTKRERAFMKSTVLGSPPSDPSINIDPLKMAVAQRFPEDEWDTRYAQALSVSNAMSVLADYNTCKRLEGWTWEVPGTPTKMFPETDPTNPVNICTVAHPRYLDEYLRVIWDRPREELRVIIDIIQSIGKFRFVEWVSPDKNHLFWRLSWVAGPHQNRNVMYLVRK